MFEKCPTSETKLLEKCLTSEANMFENCPTSEANLFELPGQCLVSSVARNKHPAVSHRAEKVKIKSIFAAADDDDQCDQMSRLFVQYLAIYCEN